MKDAVDRLERYDLETAQVLRGLIANLDHYQLAGSYLNLDAITMLDHAARSIGRSMDPDMITLLNQAAIATVSPQPFAVDEDVDSRAITAWIKSRCLRWSSVRCSRSATSRS